MARSKRVTLRVMVTVPEDTGRRELEARIDKILRTHAAYDPYVRVQQEDPE